MKRQRLCLLLALALGAGLASCDEAHDAADEDAYILPDDYPDDPSAFSEAVLVADEPVRPDPYQPIE